MRPLGGREHVALVHGYLANKFMLAPLGWRLGRQGYDTTAWGYWNMRCSLLVHAARFAGELESLDANPAIDTLHLVTHSMGGIIARAALDRFRPRKLGRFVMLAPPNKGSFVATKIAGTIGRVFKPVAELSTADDSLVNSLPMPEGVDLGVIAAKWDALVSDESTHPDAPHAYATIPTFQSGLLFRRDAADLVASFLERGEFPAGAA
jgi:pimeloyl-ACP methyl ester carboxylesterase